MRWMNAAFVAMALCVLSPAANADALAPAIPPQVSEHIRSYVAAVNSGSELIAEQFRAEHTAGEYLGSVPRDPFVRFFTNQKRVTGGLELLEVRLAGPQRAELLLRDKIYGARHGLALSFDSPQQTRITDIAPGPPPEWAGPAGGPLRPRGVRAAAERAIDRGCRSGVFSGSVLVARNGQVLVEKACGFSSRRYGVLNRPDTRFNLGSMNKMFTAVAVMQLMERGKLSLDDPLSRYADESWLPRELSQQITIRHLLTHTSGLGSFLNPDFEASSRLRFRALDDYKPLVRNERLAFQPGADFKYSDTGMLLLGVVIEKVSGEDYFTYVRNHVFRPARMADTDSWAADEPAPNLAMGYGWAPGTEWGWRENTLRHVLRGNPAGGGYSTVSDLLRFSVALQSGVLISKPSLDYLWAGHPPNNYGAGFTVTPTSAGKAVGHDGIFSGISSRLEIYPDTGYLVAILANQDYAAPGLNDALEEVVARAPRR